MTLKLQVIFITEINKKPKNSLLPIFSPDFKLNGPIGLFYAEKWIFLKKLGTLLKRKIEDFLFCEDKNNWRLFAVAKLCEGWY